jgi:hypothetical protein
MIYRGCFESYRGYAVGCNHYFELQNHNGNTPL